MFSCTALGPGGGGKGVSGESSFVKYLRRAEAEGKVHGGIRGRVCQQGSGVQKAGMVNKLLYYYYF